MKIYLNKKILNNLKAIGLFIKNYAPLFIILISVLETILVYPHTFKLMRKMIITTNIIIVICSLGYTYDKIKKKDSSKTLLVCIIWLFFQTIWTIYLLC